MHIELPLPPGYRADDVLAFHGRDPEGVAEQVAPDRIHKAVLLDGVAVLLTVVLAPGVAACDVHADGAMTASIQAQARAALAGMLGLLIDPQPFLHAVAGDPLLGPVARRQSGLRVIQSASVFEALTWAIIGQQINLPFAIALRRSFILQAGRRHSGGLWCYPDPAAAARIGADALTTRKFSRAKADTLLRLAALVDGGTLVLDRDDDIARTSAALLAIKGIGPWTVNYALLRGYGYPDCSLHGDVAIRTAFQRLLGKDTKPDIARTEALLAAYRPHRTMACAHLWASLSAPLHE